MCLNYFIVLLITVCTLFFQQYIAKEYDMSCMIADINNVISEQSSLEKDETSNISSEEQKEANKTVQEEEKEEAISAQSIYPLKEKTTTVYSNKYTKGQIEAIVNKLTFTEKIKFISISNKLSKPTCERLFKLSADGITSIEEQEIWYTLKAILNNDDYLYVYNVFDKYKPF